MQIQKKAANKGFELIDRVLRYKSPFGRILPMGHQHCIWRNLTEERMHNVWTITHCKAFADTLRVDLNISLWNEETKMITTSARAYL